VKGGNIQTILVESEAEVQPPVNISHVQWLDMHDWKTGHGIVRFTNDKPDADNPLGQTLEKSEGVFLYVERFCGEVQQDHLSLDRSNEFPQGLGGIFYQWFQRQFPDLEKFRKDVRPALRAILASLTKRKLEWSFA